ncbi:MAG: YbfB/YjiJ family MFS transporter [Rhodobacteraceae bacterium]|nr:YbfB/YjiJ family MFS transporter [Paracoccaceae bacterium]
MDDGDKAGALTDRRAWIILLGLSLGVCVTNGFARFAYGLILPAMQADLGWTYAQAGWLNTANALGYIVGALLTMRLITRVVPSRLFSFGLVSTAFALFATGLDEALWWQTLWRVAAGVLGAMSFSTAGVLTAQLFHDNPRRNALAIAILFGFGGGLGIVLAGAVVPPLLFIWGNGAWPWVWIAIGTLSFCFVPLGLWAAEVLRPPPSPWRAAPRLPLRRMWREIVGYGGFGLGYIVYLTFLGAWMQAQQIGPALTSVVWVLLGLCISVSPFAWRGIFARFAGGQPLAMVLGCIAFGSVLPVVLPSAPGLVLSAVVFGLAVFMAPGAVTSFTRQNLPAPAWGASISLFTVVFAFSQTLGPIGAGYLGDLTGSIGSGLLAAAAALLVAGAVALTQRPLDPSP